MSLILHCGAERATREQVEAVPVPARTRSWRPVAYKDAIDLVEDRITSRLGMEISGWEFGLQKGGSQMFGVARVATGSDESELSIGFRQSYNKTLSLGVVAGASILVCDNLCFSGEHLKVVRKNTTNVWSDFRCLLDTQMANALHAYQATVDHGEHLKATPCNQRRGYALLGVALGEGILSSTQANIAFRDWDTPRHEEFADRNMWSLYNCFTEGLKKGQPGRLIERHTVAHDWFRALPTAA